MNNIALYRQILKGQWFIDFSYAISLAPILARLLMGSNQDDFRDWDGNQTENLAENPERAPFPILAAASSAGISKLGTYDDAPEGSVAIIPLKSVMMKYGTWCNYGTEEIALFMIQAGKSDKINGIVLDIDSGGGAVDAVPPLVEAIRHIQTVHKKPVIGSADLCASAAYYTASYCDMLFANNDISSQFGSIGVMISFADIQPYYERLGVKFHTIYAPESNYKNVPFEKALKGDYAPIQEELLSPLAVKFQNDVKKARGNKLDQSVAGLLNGRMFFASNEKDPALTAKAVGLIDGVANLDHAILTCQAMGEVVKFMKK